MKYMENLSRLLRAARIGIKTRGLGGVTKRAWQEINLRNPGQLLQKWWHSPKAYARWIQREEPTREDLELMRQQQRSFGLRPVISVIMPTYRTPGPFLREAIESVRNQVYPNWQLCIADDCSRDEELKKSLTEYAGTDSRIVVAFRAEQGHISAASNTAVELAAGDFIIPLDHDDVLSVDALFQFVRELNEFPETDFFYSDEDQLDSKAKRIKPYFKPDWSPETLLTRMYTGHAAMYRKSLFEETGGFREQLEGAQDHDLALRFTERTKRIRHVPKVLYHWRVHERSTAAGHGAKGYASAAGQRAVEDALDRRGTPAKVRQIPGHAGRYEIQYELQAENLISILIPTRDQAGLLDTCLTSIFEKSSYRNFEIIQIDNGSIERSTREVFNQWKTREPDRYRVVEIDIPFNFSRLNNLGVQHARGDYLLFLNNDMEVLSENWLEIMLGQAQIPDMGAIGCMLLYPDNTIQHAGIVLGIGEQAIAGHSHKHFPASTSGYMGNVLCAGNFSAVTGACLMCKKDEFLEVGGFDERLAVAFNDVDLCLKFLDKGLRNVFLPQVKLFHHESRSRGLEDSEEKVSRFQNEAALLRETWSTILDNDPNYSPNLSRVNADFSIRP